MATINTRLEMIENRASAPDAAEPTSKIERESMAAPLDAMDSAPTLLAADMPQDLAMQGLAVPQGKSFEPTKLVIIGAGTAASISAAKFADEMTAKGKPFHVTIIDKSPATGTIGADGKEVASVAAPGLAGEAQSGATQGNVIVNYKTSLEENLASLNADAQGHTKLVQGAGRGAGGATDQLNRPGPTKQDWEDYATMTGDPSLRHEAALPFIKGATAVQYHPLIKAINGVGDALHIKALSDFGGIGRDGYMPVSTMEKDLVDNDPQLSVTKKLMREHMNKSVGLKDRVLGWLSGYDPNISWAPQNGFVEIPLAMGPSVRGEHLAGRRANPADVLQNAIDKNPKSFTIIAGAKVEKFVGEKKADGTFHATGVSYRDANGDVQVQPADLVENSAGIFSSVIAQKSGFGAKADLEKLGVQQIADVAGVGQAYGGRVEMAVKVRLKDPVKLLGDVVAAGNRDSAAFKQWESGKGGPLTSSFIYTGFQRSFKQTDGKEKGVMVVMAHAPFLGYTNNMALQGSVGKIYTDLSLKEGKAVLTAEEMKAARTDLATFTADKDKVDVIKSLDALATYHKREGNTEAVAQLSELAKSVDAKASIATGASDGRFDPNQFDPNVVTFIIVGSNKDIQKGTIEVDPKDPNATIFNHHDDLTIKDHVRDVTVPIIQECLAMTEEWKKAGIVDKVVFPPPSAKTPEQLFDLAYTLAFNHHPRGGLSMGSASDPRTATDSHYQQIGTDNVFNNSAAIQGRAMGAFLEKGVEIHAVRGGATMADRAVNGFVPAQKANRLSTAGAEMPTTLAEAQKASQAAVQAAKDAQMIGKGFVSRAQLERMQRGTVSRVDFDRAWKVIGKVLEKKGEVMGGDTHTIAHNLLLAMDRQIKLQDPKATTRKTIVDTITTFGEHS